MAAPGLRARDSQFYVFFFLVLARNGLVVASRLGAGGDEVAILRFFILRFFLGSARRIFTILFNFFSLG